MVIKKIWRFILFTLLGLVAAMLIFVMISIAPVDRTPAQALPSYQIMMNRLDSLQVLTIPAPTKNFSVGYSKINLTPSRPLATAGYGNRKGKLFTVVHDSIFVRTMVVDNGTVKVAIVSADLLIIPPTVTEVLARKLPLCGFSLENCFLSATHTHNSIGHWGEGATRFIYGPYDEEVVQFIADKIIESIRQASSNTLPSKLFTTAVPIGTAVQNRLITGGKEDSLFRVVEVHRADSSKLILSSYTAHPTCLFSKNLELSRDYPGNLVDEFEREHYAFAMFMAGSVGSHGCSPPEYGWDCLTWMADEIVTTYLSQRSSLKEMHDSTLFMKRVPLALGDPQVKIWENWKVRSWLFREAFGEYAVSLSVLRLGDLVMLGTPCDFSGEFNASIDSTAHAQGLNAIVTSFNGGYIGYVTPSRYYDRKHYETQLMNWYPPGNGEYIQESLKKLVRAISDKK